MARASVNEPMDAPRIAIAHDYLTQRGGAERVVLSMHKAFPEATIYTTLYDPEKTFPEFANANIVTSPLNAIPLFRRDHRLALPLLAPISSSFDVPADIVLTSSSGWAHGFAGSGRKIVYCHTPARWLYLRDHYLGDGNRSSPQSIALNFLAPFLKKWDQKHAQDLRNKYLANSTVVQQRIESTYGIHAPIIFPPHSLDTGGVQESVPELSQLVRGEYLLVVARLMKYKNVDKIIEATSALGVPLVIVGSGPEKSALESMAGETTVLLSDLTDAQLRSVYSGAKALIAASHEDFGITPLEAASWGIPTVALRKGGYLDTIVENETGLFFDEPQPNQIAEAIQGMFAREWDSSTIRSHADDFSEARFIDEIRDAVLKFSDHK